jgi:recombination protein RecR
LISQNDQEIEELIQAIKNVKKIKTCHWCFNRFEGEKELCEICSNPSRDKSLICIVEKETDLESIEKIKKYQGFYFILGGTVSMLKKDDINKLRIKELEKRIQNHPEIKEVILALNPTTEGEATSLYLERFLKPLNKKITRLARGLPTGGELEYADEQTLRDALERRR